MTSEAVYDCIILGGGPAGLTCALFLSRARRSVLVIDAGQPRNAAARGIHGFLGQHGIRAHELLHRGRDEAGASGAEFIDATAGRVGQVESGFIVAAAGQSYLCRRLVLAYGLRDILPDVPDFDTFYGHSIFHCPDCDAYEVRERPVGVIGWEKKVAGVTLQLRQWTDRLAVLTHGHEPRLTREELRKLSAQQIPIKTERIVGLAGDERALRQVMLSSGERLELAALFFSIGSERSASVAEGLGCELDEISPHVKVDAKRETTIEGVYAVGDLVAGAQLAVTAAADGAIAAVAINKSLLDPEWTV